jgi:hypothetical protein
VTLFSQSYQKLIHLSNGKNNFHRQVRATAAEVEAAAILLNCNIHVILEGQNVYISQTYSSNDTFSEIELLLARNHYRVLIFLSDPVFSKLPKIDTLKQWKKQFPSPGTSKMLYDIFDTTNF